jgi:two-component system, OmpR family, KDP operon response regulator KdpE
LGCGVTLKPDRTVLIIDSDKASRRLVRAILEAEGYRVIEAKDSAIGIDRATDGGPDIIILEIALADSDGLVVLQRLRQWSRAPVLVLSEKADDTTKVAALDAGANDYLTKPFSSAELLARLRVVQRPRPTLPEGPLLVAGDLVVNLGTRETVLSGCSINLSPKEQVLFYILARYAGTVVTCEHLSESIWGTDSEEKLHDLRVLVWQLRKRLEPHGADELVRTEGSIGYSLVLSRKQTAGFLRTPIPV